MSKIAKNTSYFTGALIIQKIISFGYFAMIAKYLGPEDLGKYYFAISFTTVFGIFIDIGLANVLTREIAREQIEENKIPLAPFTNEGKKVSQGLLSSVLAIKIPLAIMSALIISLLINFLGYSDLVKTLVYMSVLCVVFDSFTVTFFAVSRGHQNLGFESIASVFFQLITLSFGLMVIWLNLGLTVLMTGLVVASTFNILYSGILLVKKYNFSIKPKFNLIKMNEMIMIAIPFGLFAIFQRFYTYIDTVMLNIISGDKYVGLYQVPFKLVFALQFLPMAFTASVYPALSRAFKEDKAKMPIIFGKAFRYLIIISLPISFGLASIADKLILLFDANYSEAVLPMIIIMLALPFLFINFPIGSYLNASDRQKYNTINMGIVAVFAVCLNLILIPKANVVGASITVLVSNIFMFILGIFLVTKDGEIKLGKLFKHFSLSFISALVMVLAIFYLKTSFRLTVIIPTAGLVYFIVLFLIKGICFKDFVEIKRSYK